MFCWYCSRCLCKLHLWSKCDESYIRLKDLSQITQLKKKSDHRVNWKINWWCMGLHVIEIDAVPTMLGHKMPSRQQLSQPTNCCLCGVTLPYSLSLACLLLSPLGMSCISIFVPNPTKLPSPLSHLLLLRGITSFCYWTFFSH